MVAGERRAQLFWANFTKREQARAREKALGRRKRQYCTEHRVREGRSTPVRAVDEKVGHPAPFHHGANEEFHHVPRDVGRLRAALDVEGILLTRTQAHRALQAATCLLYTSPSPRDRTR